MTHCEPNTWGGVVAHAIEHGAELRSHKDFKNLFRETEDGESVYYPLPKHFANELRVGPMRWMEICSRLKIPEPNWAVEL